MVMRVEERGEGCRVDVEEVMEEEEAETLETTEETVVRSTGGGEAVSWLWNIVSVHGACRVWVGD